MSRKIKALIIIIAIVIVSAIAITVTTKEEPYSSRKVCNTSINEPYSGFIDETGCPLTDEEYKEVNDYISSGIFSRQPVGTTIFVVAFISSIAVLVYGIKKPKQQ